MFLLLSVVDESADDVGHDFLFGRVFDLDRGGEWAVHPIKLLKPKSFWGAEGENGIFVFEGTVFEGVRIIGDVGRNNFESVFCQWCRWLPEAVMMYVNDDVI